MQENRIKIKLSEYGSLEEKSECFLQRDKYLNNCIRQKELFIFSSHAGISIKGLFNAERIGAIPAMCRATIISMKH